MVSMVSCLDFDVSQFGGTLKCDRDLHATILTLRVMM